MTGGAELLEACLLSENDWIGALEVCRLCQIDMGVVVELAESGAVSPRGSVPEQWQLPANSLPRMQLLARLIRDLGVNASGAALAVELLEEQRQLVRRLNRLERLLHD